MRTLLQIAVGVLWLAPPAEVLAQGADNVPTRGEATIIQTFVPQCNPHFVCMNQAYKNAPHEFSGTCRYRATTADGWGWATARGKVEVYPDGTCRRVNSPNVQFQVRIASGNSAYQWIGAWCDWVELVDFHENGQLRSCVTARTWLELAPGRRSCPAWSGVYFDERGLAVYCTPPDRAGVWRTSEEERAAWVRAATATRAPAQSAAVSRGPGVPSAIDSALARCGSASARRQARDTAYANVTKSAVAIAGHGVPVFPGLLRSAGVEGEVIASFEVDAAGRVDVCSFRVVESSHDMFTAAVRDRLLEMRFTPAELGGRRVRQSVVMPFRFRLQR